MDLNELLQQAQRLTNETKIDVEVPRVERTISQVLQATQELHSRVTQTGTNDLQAHILMGSKGVDLPKLAQKLESLSARKSFEPLDPVTDTDVQGYMKNERENAILSVIEETNRNIFDSVEKRKWRCIYADWGEEKERLLNALVGPKQEDFPDAHRLQVPTVLNQGPVPSTRLNRIETLYAREITEYNQATLPSSLRPTLVSKFSKLAKSHFNDDQVAEMWAVVEHMTNITPLTRKLDPIETRQKTPHFVHQARNYLECRYKEYMNTVIRNNLVVAQRGGVPSTFNMVNAFVKVQFQYPPSLVGLLDVVNNRPLWPSVYFSLRCGDWNAAMQFLKEAGNYSDLCSVMMQKSNPNVDKTKLKAEGQLKLEYSNKVRVSTDPYKRAVYAIVLACDPNDAHAEIMRTIDDFLWLQLSILRTVENRDYNIEQLTYGGLQSMILEKYGENYFNAREKVPLYFQVLMLTGQFESAIEFLARNESNRSHAVHMAIALNDLCMLGGPSTVQKPLLCMEAGDPTPMRRLNLARLIIMYAKAFEHTDTYEALQYYYLLRHYKTEEGQNLLLTCVCDLLVENCNESMLELVFGKAELPDSWQYQGGVFSQYNTMDYDRYTLAGMVGDELKQRSNYEAAIKLYFIANQFDKALRVVTSLLSQVVHQPAREGTLRERLFAVTAKLNKVIATRKTEVEAHILVTYTLLSELLRFFDYYHKGKYRLASEILTKLKLSPKNFTEVDNTLTSLKRVGPEFIKVLPDVLLAAMEIVYKEYKDQKALDTHTESNEIALRYLRERAKAITNVAATVPYRMPVDINKRLVQMEILMH